MFDKNTMLAHSVELPFSGVPFVLVSTRAMLATRRFDPWMCGLESLNPQVEGMLASYGGGDDD